MNECVPSNPEQQVSQQVLTPDARHANPTPPCLDLRGAQRTRTGVRFWREPPNVPPALEHRDGDPRSGRDGEIERKAREVLQAQNARDEAGEAGRELGSVDCAPRTVAIDPMMRVLCIALRGCTALAAGEYCDWLSAAGAFMGGRVVIWI